MRKKVDPVPATSPARAPKARAVVQALAPVIRQTSQSQSQSQSTQEGTRSRGWEKPANGSVQWSTIQGGLSNGINVQSGPCFKLPPGFAPSHAARAAGLNECN